METIANKLQTIKDATSSIKESIIEKGGNISGDITTWSDAIDSLTLEGQQDDDVLFYDYDGTILHSYSANKFLSLSEMPELPVQEGLICQEWNWSLEDAQDYVSKYGKCDIGATYITDDGKTRIYIGIENYNHRSVEITLTCKAVGEAYIDWGDGTSITTLLLSSVGSYMYPYHTYNDIGNYCISIFVAQGCKIALGRDSYSNIIGVDRILSKSEIFERIEIGAGIVGISKYCFYCLSNVKSLTIPNTVEEIGSYAFGNLQKIKHITIPKNINALNDWSFERCFWLESLSIPNSVIKIGSNVFSSCYVISRVIIPSNVTEIGSNIFSNCTNISFIIIPDNVVNAKIGIITSCDYMYLGSGVQSFDSNMSGATPNIKKIDFNNNAHLFSKFQGTYNNFNFSDAEQISLYCNSASSFNYVNEKHLYLKGSEINHLEIPDDALKLPQRAFANCPNLQKVTIGQNVTKIEYGCFTTCENLAEVNIQNGVQTIGSGAFNKCINLKNISIPDSVTSIDNPFGECHLLEYATIGNGITRFNTYTFYQCSSLKKVIVGTGVQEIDSNAFYACYALSEVYFHGNVTSITCPAFYYCNLNVIDFSNNTVVPTISSSSLLSNNYHSNYNIIVPDNLYDEWKIATNWSSLSSKIVKKSDWDAQNA